MADGIAGINGWVSILVPRGVTRQRYYSSYQEETFGNHPAINAPDIYWETESLSSLSKRSWDHNGPCCACDCDCQPTTNETKVPYGRPRVSQNKPSFLYSTSLQGHGVGHQPMEHFYGRGKTNPQPNDLVGANSLYGIQDVPSAEDIIYYNAKQQRHLNDAQKRIQDWTRVMPDLVGNNIKSSTYHKSKTDHGRNSKESKIRTANKSEKEKEKGRDVKRKERGRTRR